MVYEPRCANGSLTYSLRSAIDYYPYGKVSREYDEERVRYQSTHNERDRETGYDFRNRRFSDATIARFNTTDPLENVFPNSSTYMYVNGNPVSVIDPNGDCGPCLIVVVVGGALVGAGTDYGFQVAKNKWNRPGITWGEAMSKDINWTSVTVSGVSGAITGGAGWGAMATIGTAGTELALTVGVLSGIIGFLESSVKQGTEKGLSNINYLTAFTDATIVVTIGAGGDLVEGFVGEGIKKLGGEVTQESAKTLLIELPSEVVENASQMGAQEAQNYVQKYVQDWLTNNAAMYQNSGARQNANKADGRQDNIPSYIDARRKAYFDLLEKRGFE